MVLAFHPGDRTASVFVHQDTSSRVTMDANTMVFDGATGRILAGPHRYGPVMRTFGYLSAMHYAWFRHLTLRWLYFLSGLAGCVLIATGFLFWTQARARRHAKEGVRGMALVHAPSVGAMAGPVMASLAFLIANRLLPEQAFVGGIPRAWMEVRVFCVVWLLTFAHAALRPRTAWHDQALLIGAGGIVVVLLNWITTGDVLPIALASGRRNVAGVYLVLLSGTTIALGTARKLTRRSVAPIRGTAGDVR